MIACYKQNIHLLPFADVFLKSLFVFAGGEIAQLVITGGRLLNWSVLFQFKINNKFYTVVWRQWALFSTGFDRDKKKGSQF